MTEHNMNPHNSSFNDRRAMLAGIGGLAAGAILTGRAQAGPLDPPPGPIAPTGKPLTEVEPRIAISSTNTPGDADSMFRIIAPGSYYLTANVIPILGKHGIKVSASGVTIDMNGFMMRGLGTISGAFDAIVADSGEERIIVRNGHIENMGRNGINFENATKCTVEYIRAYLCQASGIVVGANGYLHQCDSSDHNSRGIKAGSDSFINACAATGNGIWGFFTDTRCTLQDCTATSNSGSGFSASGLGNRFLNCQANLNGGTGILTDSGSVHDCIAMYNSASGIQAGLNSLVRHCRCFQNTTHGILVSSDCTLLENNCAANGLNNDGAGILVGSSDNRIEGNHCIDNAIGLRVSGSRNLIIRNSCARNTSLNWSIDANNHYGPILNRVGVGTGAVSGNFSPSSLESTDPHANFTY